MKKILNPRLRIFLLLLPLLGLGLGYAIAHLDYLGLLNSWHKVGQPGQKIVQILGIRQGRDVLVATESGQFFSLQFFYEGSVELPVLPAWKEETQAAADPPARINYYGVDITNLPPLFKAEQLYEHEYIYRTEGQGKVIFALASDGNLWIWRHELAGLAGLVYFFFPIWGLISGLVIVLVILFVRWFKARLPVKGTRL
jgi:hypothetical protein